MATTANIIPTAGTDGIPYCTNVPLTPTEADLGDNLLSPHPIPVEYGQTIAAVVQLTTNGIINQDNSYVVMQTDMGDGVWIDVAALTFTQTGAGTFTYLLVGTSLRTLNTSLQQSRPAGSTPTTLTPATPLLGRVRFTGLASFAGGSSSAPGVPTQVTATIKYKLMGPR